MALCPGILGWAGTRRNMHPLTPILLISHPLSASSIATVYSILLAQFVCLTVCFAQPLSKSSLVYFLIWNPPLCTPYISSPSHCLPFAMHAHTIAVCFAVVARLYPLFVVWPFSPFVVMISVNIMHIINAVLWRYCLSIGKSILPAKYSRDWVLVWLSAHDLHLCQVIPLPLSPLLSLASLKPKMVYHGCPGKQAVCVTV